MTGNEIRDQLIQAASALRRAGRLSEAATAYERLLARWPDLPECWYNLAFLQRHLGRFEAALASYQHALDRGVTQPEEVHLNRGVIYADHLRRDDAAEHELNAALKLNPNYVPALLNLANLMEDRGERDQARALYERILAVDPIQSEALARYANLKAVTGPADPLIARLRDAIARAGANAAEKASLGFALGKALDESGAYDQAFEAYVLANRHSRESAGPGRVLYDRRRQEQLVDELIRTFTPERFSPQSSAKSAPPIFICGMFRSGSTLAEQVLASHPRVTSGGELDLLPAMVRSHLTPFPAAVSRLSEPKRATLAEDYRAAIQRLFPNAEFVTDKRPDNFLCIGLIKALFPNAKIIHTTRDPLDNCLSVFFLHLDHSMGYALDLTDTAHYYTQYRRLMAHWKSLYGADILDFDYDAFVREPRPAIERLLAFLGLEWDEACLSFHRTKNVVKTASVWQVREPLHVRSSGRWRNYARQLTSLRDNLGPFCPPIV